MSTPGAPPGPAAAPTRAPTSWPRAAPGSLPTPTGWSRASTPTPSAGSCCGWTATTATSTTTPTCPPTRSRMGLASAPASTSPTWATPATPATPLRTCTSRCTPVAAPRSTPTLTSSASAAEPAPARQGRGRGPTAASQQARARPVLAENVLVEEGEHGLVPDPRIRRLQGPVVLVGEVEELRVHPAELEVRPQPQRLADRHAVVALAVDHQHGRADRVGEPVGGVLAVARGVPLRRAELAVPVGGAVGGAAELLQRPDAGVGHDAAEAVGVAGDPVGHVAAEGPAHRGGAGL